MGERERERESLGESVEILVGWLVGWLALVRRETVGERVTSVTMALKSKKCGKLKYNFIFKK